ncbi:MAG: hypothetical protein ACYCW6_07865 [Candidatus Xenobia bacterium]
MHLTLVKSPTTGDEARAREAAALYLSGAIGLEALLMALSTLELCRPRRARRRFTE